MTEWEVWLNDGTTRNSAQHTWDDVPDGILVVRYWKHPKFGKGINWDNGGFYGPPDETMRTEGRVSDEEFAKVLAAARASTVPPSGR